MELLIAGNRVAGNGRESIDVVNPATGAVIDQVPEATREDVESSSRPSRSATSFQALLPVNQLP